jgi:hypothetical protein
MNSRPPPKAPVPLSSDEMAIIKKKVAPPKGPPPAGFANFKAPKKYSSEDENENNYPHERKGYADQYEDGSGHKRSQGHSARGDRYSNDRYDDDEIDDQKNYKSSNYQVRENLHERPYRDYEDDEDGDDDDGNQFRHQHQGQQMKRNSKMSHADNDHQRHTDEDDNEYYQSSNRGSNHPYPPHSSHSHARSTTSSAPAPAPRLKIFNYKETLRSSFKELKSFVTTPCEVNTIVRCYIERNRSGSNYLTPVYSLCADLEDGTGRELISCRKFLKSKTSYYIFSLKSEDLYRKREQRGRYYLGKLRAMANDTYVLYDNGVCDTMPTRNGHANGNGNGLNSDTVDEVTIGDLDDDDFDENGSPIKGNANGEMMSGTAAAGAGAAYEHDESSLYRSQLAIMRYNTKHRPVEEGERGMEVCLPRVVPGIDPSQVTRHADMLTSFEKIQKSGRQNELFGNKYLILHEKRSR